MVVVILAIGAGLVVWKKKVGGTATTASFNSISREEIELLLSDVAKTNPMILKKLADDPEMKKQQIENLKQLLAFASQAQKDGLASDPSNTQEMDNIRAEIIAVNYDREINKDKGPMPAFGFITDDMTKAYWAEDDQPKSGPGLLERIGLGTKTEQRTHAQEFDDFLNAKIAVLKAGNPEMKDREISDEEKTQARDIFAKIRIYKAEYDKKLAAGELTKDFIDKANLQVKLQQAQFLARLYSTKVTDQTKVTDEDIAAYIAAHPELDPAQKKAKAQGILDQIKGGADFAKLADEVSDDPGTKGKGGLYADTPKGRMVAPFEAAALALEPGQVSPELVETDFGYHIIKLERKLGPGKEKGADGKPTETYDVRHILISTGFKDPDNPTAREAPVKDYVRNKLETEKEKKVIDDIVKANNIQVPDDFTVPTVTEEQMNELKKKQQQQMPPGMQPGGPDADGDGPPAGGPPAGKPAPGKPAPGKPGAPAPEPAAPAGKK